MATNKIAQLRIARKALKLLTNIVQAERDRELRNPHSKPSPKPIAIGTPTSSKC